MNDILRRLQHPPTKDQTSVWSGCRILWRGQARRASYRGQDRPTLSHCHTLPRSLLLQEIALEDRRHNLRGFLAFLEALGRYGERDYELVWLGDAPPSEATFLGYDVGETLSTAWSGLRHWHAFMTSSEWAAWYCELNEHGLFQKRHLARLFLQIIVTEHSLRPLWIEQDLFAIIPVYSLESMTKQSHDATQ